MGSRLDAEIETLLDKYAGGRMPPFVDMEDTKSGLINGELLQVYHSGILSRHSLPLGILLAAKRYSSLEERWRKEDFELNEWARPRWPSFCKTLRATQVGNEVCDECDRRRAIMAERQQGVIAYLCDGGMIDFAVPISVKGEAVAMLFCGQFKPREGPIWNPEFIQHDGLFRPLEPGEEGVDVLIESQQRMREIERKVALPEGTLLECVSDPANPAVEISPQEVEETQQLLRKAAAQLSDLATSTYELEKGMVVDWIRNRIARSLAPLSAPPVQTVEVWKQLSLSLEYVIRYFELDYILILSCRDEIEEETKVVCQSGLPEAIFPIGERLPAATASLATFRSTVCGLEEPVPITLRDYKNLPLFDRLHRLHAEGGERALVIPVPSPLVSGTAGVILGRFKRDTELSTFSPDDCEALIRMSEGVTLVAETILLVEQLKETARKQALFVEDVAHDIRTPIQNIIVEATLLTRELTSPKETKRLARRLASQVRRLHLMSERVWTLVNIDRGTLQPDEAQSVNVYQTLMEHRKSLLDLAARREIQILVDRELEGWPPIQVNKVLFSQAILNLTDNAVKYSRKGTEVRIDGKRSPSGVTLSFVSRGIPIREEEKDSILERYYRTKEAQVHTRAGTGIGLFIVKTFVDHCRGSIEVNSVPVHGTRDYVTEFKIYIPHRGW